MTRVAGALVVAAALGTGCADDAASDSRSRGVEGTVTVFAASSLSEAFEQIGAGFEREHPDADVELSFGASTDLAAQIQQGAPGDVFASADEVNMRRLVDRNDVTGPPTVFARNRLAIAVEEGNPKDIDGLADLDGSGLLVILCAAEVPCGRFADEALDRAGVSVTPASRAENVKAALAPVELGEADAAIVYVTDVRASGGVDSVPIARRDNVIATYPIATVTESDNRSAANAFVDYVTSPAAQRVLAEFGFLAP